MKLEVFINTTRGPVAESRTVEDRVDACASLWAVFVDAFGSSLTNEHVAAQTRICRELQYSELPVMFKSPAVSVRLSA